MQASPIISVILPLYNAEAYIAEAIQSILNQTFTDFELLILDNDSTDNSFKVAQTFSDSRITLLTQSNIGLSGSLNKALKMAKGKYIARMDADDISLPQRFEKQIQFLESNKDHVLVGTWAEIFSDTENALRFHRHPTTNIALQYFLLFDNPFVHSSVMFRKEVVDKIGYYYDGPERFEDYDFWWRMAKVGKIANLPEDLQRYREVNSGISKTTDNYRTRVMNQSKLNMIDLLPQNTQGVNDIVALYFNRYENLSANCSAANVKRDLMQICVALGEGCGASKSEIEQYYSQYISSLLRKIRLYKTFGFTYLYLRKLYLKIRS